ncbi:hypothetical protein Anas_05231 [Armadillidium nasatum]|uniref:Uncharacterized protein n=1 Tax=Armadillidium nasatum TaxID=96803 RepID=A0A5N5SVG1_9CRUS|nr:hypothetical protein Anas_05231 [Armadillidium nasatum]
MLMISGTDATVRHIPCLRLSTEYLEAILLHPNHAHLLADKMNDKNKGIVDEDLQILQILKCFLKQIK